MVEIDKYFEYYRIFPQLFRFNRNINIILDKEELIQYANEKNCKLGVAFENSYFTLIVDLVENSNGDRYPYARLINKNKYNGVVVIPILKNKIVFLKQFRHGTREYEIELPRGFSEQSMTIQENAVSEIYEELGAHAARTSYLGSIISDSSLSGGLVHVFACEIDHIRQLSQDEGISDTVQLSPEEAEAFISENRIRDCFSISAIFKFKIWSDQQGEKECF